MYKNMAYFFASITLSIMLVLVKLFTISADGSYVEAVQSQSNYTLTLSRTRGTIYDCNMRPLAGGRALYKAVVLSGETPVAVLEEHLSAEQFESVKQRLKNNYPFAITVSDGTLSNYGINVYKTSQRYTSYYPAVHTVGYLDYSGTQGITGIERAFDQWLSDGSGEYKVTCQVDGLGRVLEGTSPQINDSTENSAQGVVLTLDADILQIVESAAQKHLKQGAIVVMEIPSGKLRALVSVPTFSPLDIASAIDNSNSALVNRCLSQYDVGSVFKLVTAASALESGISPSRQYECTGSLTIGNNTFTCSGNKAHGVLNMEGGICYSCNLYFIQLAQEVGAQRLLATAQFFGFGESIVLAPEYESFSGNLPSFEKLQNPAALANFSFGQGELLATPLQIAAMVGSVASGGKRIIPQLVEKTVDRYGNTNETFLTVSDKMIINTTTSQKLCSFMRAAVLDGTAQPGATEKITSAAKTGTAETGIRVDGAEIVQAWYAGFFPYENPQYVCVVLAENGSGGGISAGPIFKEIAEGISKYMTYKQ